MISISSFIFPFFIFRGRKLWAFNFLCDLRAELKSRELVDPFWVFLVALMKITPEVLLFPRRRGSGLQWIPLPLSERKQYTFAVKWVIKLLRDKSRKVTVSSVADALVSAIYDQGPSIEKKNSVHSIAELNRHLVRFFR